MFFISAPFLLWYPCGSASLFIRVREIGKDWKRTKKGKKSNERGKDAKECFREMSTK